MYLTLSMAHILAVSIAACLGVDGSAAAFLGLRGQIELHFREPSSAWSPSSLRRFRGLSLAAASPSSTLRRFRTEQVSRLTNTAFANLAAQSPTGAFPFLLRLLQFGQALRRNLILRYSQLGKTIHI